MQARQQCFGVAEREREHDAARVQMQPMQAREQRRPLREHLRRERIVAVHAAQRRGVERMLLDGHVMQACGAVRVRCRGAPGLEKVHPQAEPGFEHREYRTAAPRFRQMVAVEEDVARLRAAAVRGVKNVAVEGGAGDARRIEFEAAGHQGRNGRQGGLAVRRAAGC